MHRPELDLRTLWTFCVLAEELHFSRAAARLGIAQPPLSQQIRRLEDKVGYPLFARTKRRVELTAAGRSLLASSQRLLEQAQSAVDLARRAARGESGRLRVAFPTSVALTLVSLILRSYRARFPAVDLQLVELATRQQIDALRAGTVDIGFLRSPPPHADLIAETVFEEEFVAMLPKGHRLAPYNRIPIAELAQEPFVLFPRQIGPEFHAEILSVCWDGGFIPNIVQEANDWQTIAALIQAGLGVSIGPSSVSRVHLDEIVYRPLVETTARTSVAMCWRADATSPLLRQFSEVAHALAARHA